MSATISRLFCLEMHTSQHLREECNFFFWCRKHYKNRLLFAKILGILFCCIVCYFHFHNFFLIWEKYIPFLLSQMDWLYWIEFGLFWWKGPVYIFFLKTTIPSVAKQTTYGLEEKYIKTHLMGNTGHCREKSGISHTKVPLFAIYYEICSPQNSRSDDTDTYFFSITACSNERHLHAPIVHRAHRASIVPRPWRILSSSHKLDQFPNRSCSRSRTGITVFHRVGAVSFGNSNTSQYKNIWHCHIL